MQLIPDAAQDWCAWAWTEHQNGRLDRARAGLEQALAIDPASLPARFGLASLLLETGDLDAATSIAAEMASTAPDHPDILWLQARLANALGEPGAARDALVRLLSNPRLNQEQRAEALLMLGLALGDLGDCVEAFAAASHGKRLQRDLHASEATGREGEVTKLRRLATWIDSTPTEWPPASRLPAPNSGASHVFLVGFPRSGTTLLEQVLAAHSCVSTLEEAPTLAAAYEAFLSDAGACAALTCLEPEEAAAWADHYWAGIRGRGVEVDDRVFVDKQPAGTLYLPIIARLFPHAKILFALRDPRDAVLSCFRQAFQMNAMTYAFTDLVEAAACYDACMALAERARTRLPLAWLDVRHEALVEDFDAELRRILDFLGLEPTPAMADFARSARSRTIRTPSAAQVRAGLNRRGLRRWEHFQCELAPALPLLAPWVERFGYQP
jgi:tetratricopeptide (TPR) repeat protein